MAKMTSASAASTPSRSASCGVKRYGSDVLGSGGRNCRDGERRWGNELAKEPHLRHPVGGVGARSTADEREDGAAEDQVEGDARQQGLEERAPRGDFFTEQAWRPSPAKAIAIVKTRTASSGACPRSRPVVSP